MIRRFENLDVTCPRHSRKARPEFAIVISNEIFRRLPIGGGFSQLLRHPGISRGSRHAYMDNPSRLQFYDEERKERPKEEIGHLQEVTGPDLVGVRAQKGRPLLTSWLLCANCPHVLLNGALADADAQFQ